MNIQECIAGAFNRHREVLLKSEELLRSEVEKTAQILFEALKNNHRIFSCGNGGSAADSQHFSGEWLCRFRDNRRSLPGMSLTTDTSTITAIGNDYSFEEIFSRQLEALGQEGDILVAFTTSGSSKNVLRAIEVAKRKKLKIIVLTGQKGAALKDQVDGAIVVPSEETARIQEIHELVYHTWCDVVDDLMRQANLI